MKALLAVEPFHQDETRLQGLYQTLLQILGQKSDIEAGFVVTRTESALNLAFDVPAQERFSVYPKELIKTALSKGKIRIADNKIHVVDFETVSTTKAVDRFLALAKSRKTQMIALFTHSKKGYQKLVLGSFAETAVHRSKLHLLLANPQTKFSPRIRHVFFASDFSRSARNQLKHTIAVCKNLKAKLTIFHSAEVIYRWSLDEASPRVRSYRKQVDKEAAYIQQQCKAAGVKCEIELRSDFVPPGEAAIEAASKSKADLIVVGSKVGPLAALMGGSVSRHVVRSSQKPVLVLKTK